MFSSFVETMELWALDNIVIIDGGAYAPIEPLYYAMADAIMADFLRMALVAVISVFGIVCFVLCIDILFRYFKKKRNAC